MIQRANQYYEFGPYRIDARERQLLRDGEVVPLTPKVYDTLLAFVENPGHILTKDELMKTVWPDSVVEENNLTRNISTLRKALGESPNGHQYIETIPWRGYRFVASVKEEWDDGLEMVVKRHLGFTADKHRLESETEPGRSSQPDSSGEALASTNGEMTITAIANKPVPQLDNSKTAPITSAKFLFGKIIQYNRSAALTLLSLAVAATAFFIYFNRAPTLTEKDTILIGDFANTTGDGVFDDSLKQALAVQLEQSPFLNIFARERIREALRFMGRSPDERLTYDVAREVCERQGIKAMLTGSIAPLGNRYIISLEAIEARTGEVISRQMVEAEGKEGVLQALGNAATKLREKLGESLASIQKFDAPIEQATTPSLEALKTFSFGREKVNQGNQLDAIPLFKRATELDPDFALAYSWLASAYGNSRQHELAVEPGQKAFALRDRVSKRERFRITGTYYRVVTGEMDRMFEELELWKQMYPHDYLPRNGMAANSLVTARFDKAIEEGREAIRLNPVFAAPYGNVARAFIYLNRFDEAREILDELELAQQSISASKMRVLLYEIAFIRGDLAMMKQQLDLAAGYPDSYLMPDAQARTSAFAGRLRQARAFSSDAVDMAERRNVKDVAAMFAVDAALREAVFGICPVARKNIYKGFSLSQVSHPEVRDKVSVLPGGTLALALCGEVGQAESLAEKIIEQHPKATLNKAIYLPLIRAAIELHRGHPDLAIQALQATGPYEAVSLFWPNYLRGQAYLQKKAGTEAMAEFQKILDHRGWDPTSYLYPLAHIGLARAATLTGDIEKSRKSYEDFFALWKDADPDIPILREARREYEKLR